MKLSVFILFMTFISLVFGCAQPNGNIKSDNSRITTDGLVDQFEEKVIISSINYNRPLISSSNGQDVFFRGYIDKKSKNVTYQLYAIVSNTTTSRESKWMGWKVAKFLKDGNLTKKEMSRVDYDVRCNSGMCRHIEDVILTLDEDVIYSWKEGTPKVRLDSSRVETYRDVLIDSKEVSAFLEAVELAMDLLN